MFSTVLNENVILMLFMVVGFLLVKSKTLNNTQMSGLSMVLTTVALPAAIIVGLQMEFTTLLLKKVITTLIVSVFVIFLSYVIGIFVTRLLKIKDYEKKVWKGCCTFTNILFIGIPVVGALYGTEGVLMLVSYNTVSMFCLFTLGIVIYKKEEGSAVDLKQFLMNPATIATFLGFFFFVGNMALPEPFFRATDSLGSLTAPLSMLITGGMLAENHLKNFMKDCKLYMFSFLRLLIIPAIMYVVLSFLISDSLIIGVIVIATAMPAGAMNVVLAEQYGSSGSVTSKYVVVTTVFSILTLPVVALLIG